jgi:hypothetical protein
VIIEAGFIALLIGAYKKASKRGVMTPERETMFYEALENIRGADAPRMFRKLAEGFQSHGFPVHAKLLRTRAKYLDVPPEVKAQRDALIAQAMKSIKPEAIEGLAYQFEIQTATGIARDLRAHAKDVREGKYPPKDEPKEKTNGHIEAKA